MNWLAHVYLSEPEVEYRLGNLLADVIKGKDRHGLTPGLALGVQCHRAIDAYTDFHPVVHRSKRRVAAEYGRFAGILVDVFYDHVLAGCWGEFAGVPLEQFTAEVYRSFQSYPQPLPNPACRELVKWLIREDRFGSYRSLDGIREALDSLSRRISRRLGREFRLEQALAGMARERAGFEDDFREFFPELCAHIARWREAA